MHDASLDSGHAGAGEPDVLGGSASEPTLDLDVPETVPEVMPTTTRPVGMKTVTHQSIWPEGY
jgi:hypothetical protein